jgi:hypothetical protein
MLPPGIDLQRSIERELKGLILFLTHGVCTSKASIANRHYAQNPLNERYGLVFIRYLISMQIRPEETELIGRWENTGRTIRADASATRIKELTELYFQCGIFCPAFMAMSKNNDHESADIKATDLTLNSSEAPTQDRE